MRRATVLSLLLPLLLACQSGAGARMDGAQGEADMAVMESAPRGRVASLQAAPAPASPVVETREIIRNGSQRVEVEDLLDAQTRIEAMVAERGGHLQHSSRSDRFLHLTVRVPAEHLDATMDGIAALGDEAERSITRQDVTEQMRDLEAELANQQTLRDRFRDLAGRAKTVEDILKVERELARVQSRVDALTGRLKRLRSQVSMSELNVTLHGPEVRSRSIPGPIQLVVRGVTWIARKLWVIEY